MPPKKSYLVFKTSRQAEQLERLEKLRVKKKTEFQQNFYQTLCAFKDSFENFSATNSTPLKFPFTREIINTLLNYELFVFYDPKTTSVSSQLFFVIALLLQGSPNDLFKYFLEKIDKDTLNGLIGTPVFPNFCLEHLIKSACVDSLELLLKKTNFDQQAALLAEKVIITRGDVVKNMSLFHLAIQQYKLAVHEKHPDEAEINQRYKIISLLLDCMAQGHFINDPQVPFSYPCYYLDKVHFERMLAIVATYPEAKKRELLFCNIKDEPDPLSFLVQYMRREEEQNPARYEELLERVTALIALDSGLEQILAKASFILIKPLTMALHHHSSKLLSVFLPYLQKQHFTPCFQMDWQEGLSNKPSSNTDPAEASSSKLEATPAYDIYNVGLFWRNKDYKFSLLQQAVSVRSIAHITTLLAQHESLQLYPSDGFEPPIFSAIELGYADIVEFLLQRDPRQIELPDPKGDTALFYAISYYEELVFKTIMTFGPNILCENEQGFIPVQAAYLYNQLDVVETLLAQHTEDQFMHVTHFGMSLFDIALVQLTVSTHENSFVLFKSLLEKIKNHNLQEGILERRNFGYTHSNIQNPYGSGQGILLCKKVGPTFSPIELLQFYLQEHTALCTVDTDSMAIKNLLEQALVLVMNMLIPRRQDKRALLIAEKENIANNQNQFLPAKTDLLYPVPGYNAHAWKKNQTTVHAFKNNSAKLFSDPTTTCCNGLFSLRHPNIHKIRNDPFAYIYINPQLCTEANLNYDNLSCFKFDKEHIKKLHGHFELKLKLNDQIQSYPITREYKFWGVEKRITLVQIPADAGGHYILIGTHFLEHGLHTPAEVRAFQKKLNNTVDAIEERLIPLTKAAPLVEEASSSSFTPSLLQRS